ncbi:hypothetical protein LTR97_005753 [Elasticomyces elasticus]|uniref:NADAR domain-containing protein n=1 Tax=Elasticomyces elasticus TaxID=574655 RepID=A0AAN7W8L4_9PEZI|nr:hypothetical protein LTR97_005753 [Elasticomyces elasticus]
MYVYYSEEEAEAELYGRRPSVSGPNRTRRRARRAWIVLLAACGFAFAVLLISAIIGNRFPWYSQTWANMLGIALTVCACTQWIPQILTTWHLGHLGSLSLTGMCLQTPYTWIFCISMMLRVGLQGWSVWIVYVLVGSAQLVLIAMGILFAFRPSNTSQEAKDPGPVEDSEGWNAYVRSRAPSNVSQTSPNDAPDERSLLLPRKRPSETRQGVQTVGCMTPTLYMPLRRNCQAFNKCTADFATFAQFLYQAHPYAMSYSREQRAAKRQAEANTLQATESIAADETGPVFFWKPEGEPYSIFCQWYPSPFLDPEVHPTHVFNCAEQCMMYQKALVLATPELEEPSPAQGGKKKGKPSAWITRSNIERARLPQEVLAARKPGLQKAITRKARFTDAQAKEWERTKFDVVVQISYCKYTQHPNLRARLLATGDRELVEASDKDRVWGIGFAAEYAEKNRAEWGSNLLGRALMTAREGLRAEQESEG